MREVTLVVDVCELTIFWMRFNGYFITVEDRKEAGKGKLLIN